MRSVVLTSLLAIWLFAVFAPSTVVLMGGESSVLVSYSFGEDEKQEQEKKDTSEEKLVPNILNGFLAQMLLRKGSLTDNYLLGNSNHLPEIPLPPPEHIG